jgi:hypothetical protein
MRDLFWRAVFAVLGVPPLARCYVQERTVAFSPCTTEVAAGCAWGQDYTDARGRVHAAHGRSPGTIDAY